MKWVAKSGTCDDCYAVLEALRCGVRHWSRDREELRLAHTAIVVIDDGSHPQVEQHACGPDQAIMYGLQIAACSKWSPLCAHNCSRMTDDTETMPSVPATRLIAT